MAGFFDFVGGLAGGAAAQLKRQGGFRNRGAHRIANERLDDDQLVSDEDLTGRLRLQGFSERDIGRALMWRNESTQYKQLGQAGLTRTQAEELMASNRGGIDAKGQAKFEEELAASRKAEMNEQFRQESKKRQQEFADKHRMTDAEFSALGAELRAATRADQARALEGQGGLERTLDDAPPGGETAAEKKARIAEDKARGSIGWAKPPRRYHKGVGEGPPPDVAPEVTEREHIAALGDIDELRRDKTFLEEAKGWLGGEEPAAKPLGPPVDAAGTDEALGSLGDAPQRA